MFREMLTKTVPVSAKVRETHYQVPDGSGSVRQGKYCAGRSQESILSEGY